jgi:tetratricopeptide (TPR) repeat protein
VRKRQIILLTAGLVLILLIFFFGNTIPPKSKMPVMPVAMASQEAALSTQDVIAAAKSKLPPEVQERITGLENNVVRGDVVKLKINQYRQLSSFWIDTVGNMPLGTYYKGETAKLENSEQNITFAARKLLSYVFVEQSQPMQTWMATQAKGLFEDALKINPANDSAKVGLGACYMFGNISSNPMQEILKVREVADKNPDNMYAQYILGLGDIKTGQYENAIKRFSKVVAKQPLNLEAIFNLADTYDRLQDKENAIKWYKVAQQMVQVPAAKKEIGQRIETLENQ